MIRRGLGKIQRPLIRGYTSTSEMGKVKEAMDGYVVGVYEGKALSGSGQRLDASLGGRLSRLLASPFGIDGEAGSTRVYYDVAETVPVLALVGLGSATAGADEAELSYELQSDPQQRLRNAFGDAARRLRAAGATSLRVDGAHSLVAAVEGARMGLHRFEELKTVDAKKTTPVAVSLLDAPQTGAEERDLVRAETRAAAVLHARLLAELPSNHLTPRLFVERAHELFRDSKNVRVEAYDEAWIQSQRMGCFWGVAKGSDEPPRFLELHYRGLADTPFADDAPLALVGKGVTFDSGGIDIKPSTNMGLMRGDMGGGASVVAALWGIAALQLKCNVVAVVPLAENMPSGRALKPADVVTSRKGLTVEVDNTDAEGRLLLCDALDYVQETYQPTDVLDVATLTGAIHVALGEAATGVFTNCQDVWEHLEVLGRDTGETMWKMPLMRGFEKELASDLADVRNCATSRYGGACTAAAFLHKFVVCKRWAHLDIAGGMHSSKDDGYSTKGMTGIPTRTLIAYAEMIHRKNLSKLG